MPAGSLSASPDVHDVYGGEPHPAWMDVDWRTFQRWEMVNGAPVNVIELGKGDPIVFIHGHAGSWTNWLEQLPDLSADHRVLAMDLPGFGRSPLGTNPISISQYARDVEALMAARGIESATIVGNSMGGFIAAELAIAFPKRVQRLALVSAAGVSTRYAQVFPTRVMGNALAERAFEVIGPLTRVSPRRASLLATRPRLRQAVLIMIAAHPDQLHPAMAWELVRGSGRPAVAAASAAIARYDFRERLGEIGAPTLIVWGASDRTVPVTAADQFARLIPGSQKVVLPDTGHVPMIERPARFNALLRAFIAQGA